MISEYQGSLNEVVVKPPIADAMKVTKSIKKSDNKMYISSNETFTRAH